MTLLIRNVGHVLTMDSERRELRDTSILVEGGRITAIGPDLSVAEQIIDASACIATPGLINTHHHLFQNLTRVVPEAADASLFNWLQRNYRIWRHLEPEDIFISAKLGLAELALSGCSTSSDHLYLYPNGIDLADTIEAAKCVGTRLHATRGFMSVGESEGGLPPDDLVESEISIMADCQRAVETHHDANGDAMIKVGIAPCSPFSVSEDLMRESAQLARSLNVMLHTHLAENDEDVDYSLSHFSCRPGEYAERLGWVGDDVWLAHCVKLDPEEIGLMARTLTGIAHCPSSNCRLASGIAPVRSMLDQGVHVGLGVDGSASNDAGSLIAEARQAMFLQRLAGGAGALTAREALKMATLGGAQVLGRSELGRIEVGACADIALWDTSTLDTSGAWDPIAALVFCTTGRVQHLIVNGKQIVSDGQLISVCEHELVQQHRKRVRRLQSL